MHRGRSLLSPFAWRGVVVAAPEFRVTEDGPYDVNVTAGRSVSMRCRAVAEPPANVTWYQNGHALDRKIPPRHHATDQSKPLISVGSRCTLMLLQHRIANFDDVSIFSYGQDKEYLILMT